MKWEEVRLDRGDAVLRFPDGGSMTLAGRERRTAAGPHIADLIVSCNSKTLEIADVVDDGQTTESPRCFLLSGESANDVIVMGGPVVYRVRSSCVAERVVALWREWRESEYWKTELVDTPYGVLVVYESGVLVIGKDHKVRWHQKKQFTDELESVQAEVVRFRDSNDGRWQIVLADGRRVQEASRG